MDHSLLYINSLSHLSEKRESMSVQYTLEYYSGLSCPMKRSCQACAILHSRTYALIDTFSSSRTLEREAPYKNIISVLYFSTWKRRDNRHPTQGRSHYKNCIPHLSIASTLNQRPVPRFILLQVLRSSYPTLMAQTIACTDSCNFHISGPSLPLLFFCVFPTLCYFTSFAALNSPHSTSKPTIIFDSIKS